jgi:hypothetical protein
MKSSVSSIDLTIKLDGIKPDIWRRFVVDSSLSLDGLHNVIQIVMGWDFEHLYSFTISGIEFGIPSDDDGFFENEFNDASKTKLSKLEFHEKDKFGYLYDFGDSWEHTIKVGKILPGESPYGTPFCIEGARNCPPEDCGSVQGYQDIVEAMKNKKSKEAKEFIDWLGEPYDPEYFDRDLINKRLKGMQKKSSGRGWR